MTDYADLIARLRKHADGWGSMWADTIAIEREAAAAIEALAAERFSLSEANDMLLSRAERAEAESARLMHELQVALAERDALRDMVCDLCLERTEKDAWNEIQMRVFELIDAARQK